MFELYLEQFGVPSGHTGNNEPDDYCECEMCVEVSEAMEAFDLETLKEYVECEVSDRDGQILSLFTQWWAKRGRNMTRPLRNLKNPFTKLSYE